MVRIRPRHVYFSAQVGADEFGYLESQVFERLRDAKKWAWFKKMRFTRLMRHTDQDGKRESSDVLSETIDFHKRHTSI